jgi:drug/metabolite transporter (DMT)-like permease
LLLVGGQGLAMVALTEVTASLGAILAATIPLWVVLLSGLIGTLCLSRRRCGSRPGSAASRSWC